MKKIILSIAFFVCFLSFSQNSETLKSTTEKMYEASYVLDYPSIIQLTYPKFFDYIDKDKMIEAMENIFENDDFRIRFIHPKIQFKYGDILAINNANYCVIQYKIAMRMTFQKKISDDMSKKIIGELLQNEDYTLVSFEKERNSFFIERNSILIAIADEVTNKEWKYINYTEFQKELIEVLLTESVVSKLGL